MLGVNATIHIFIEPLCIHPKDTNIYRSVVVDAVFRSDAEAGVVLTLRPGQLNTSRQIVGDTLENRSTELCCVVTEKERRTIQLITGYSEAHYVSVHKPPHSLFAKLPPRLG